MSFRSKGLVLAMEDDAPVVQVEINAENEVPAEVEADVAEVSEQAGEVDDLVTAVEEAEQDSETLSRMADVMEESADSGEGLDETAAEIAEVAVESICNRLGIRTYGRAMPSLESFGGKSSRVTATRISVENIKEWIIKTWEAIKKAFSDMWQRVKAFFERFFTANGRVLETAKKMKEALKGFSSTKVKGAAFQDPSVARLFPDKNDFGADTFKQILADHKGPVDSVLTFVSGLNAEVEGVTKKVEEAQKANHGEGDAAKASKKTHAKAIVDQVGTFIENTLTKAKNGFTTSIPGNMKDTESGSGKSVYSPMLCGGKAVAIRQIEGAEGVPGMISANVITLTDKTVMKAAESASFDTLDPDQMEVILDQVIASSNTLSELRKVNSALGNVEKTFTKTAENAINKAKSMDDSLKTDGKSGADDMIKGAQKALTGLGKAAGLLCTAIPECAVSANKAALRYVSKSMAQSKKGMFDK